VISFRSKDDINTLSLQLSQVQQYADNLRAVQHEHRNLISTIAGLLFLKRYDNALDLIQQQSESHQKVLDFIARNFKEPPGRAVDRQILPRQRARIRAGFRSACFVERFPPPFRIMNGSRSWGICWITPTMPPASAGRFKADRMPDQQRGREVIIEIADQGCGIDESLRDRIFERGVTSSDSKDHGIGLWLVRSYVEQAGGSIVVENNIPFGTIFTFISP
jgi:two-component system cit operon sensor histidine kinase CitA